MPANEEMRNYRMTNGELCSFTSNLCNILTRDLTALSVFGMTAPKIAVLKALGDAFEIFTTDEVYLANIMAATEVKNEIIANLREEIRNMVLRCQMKWGANSHQERALAVSALTRLNDDSLLVTARRVHEQMTLYLTDLTDLGLTQDLLDSFEDLFHSFEDAMNEQKNRVNERDIKTKERIRKGNELYQVVSDYCDIGKRVFEMNDPARYDDYIIYTSTSPGTLTAPTNLVFNYSSKVLWWDAVDNAVSYQLQWFDGTDFVEIYSGSDINFGFTPPDGLNKFRVRAHNAGGYGPWSEILEQYYFAVLPKAVNLQIVQNGTIPTEGELTWNAVPTAASYKVYQSVDNIGEYAAHWLVIGTVTEPMKAVVLTLGKRNSFRVETNNTYQTSMSDVVFIEVS